MFDPITDRLDRARSDGPTQYRCGDCGREFEVDAPPSRAVCSECMNEDVTMVEA